MLKFITDVQSNEPDILSEVAHEKLLIMSIEGQFLASYDAPKKGWTHDVLLKMSQLFPTQWNFCGADAYLSDKWVGSTEV